MRVDGADEKLRIRSPTCMEYPRRGEGGIAMNREEAIKMMFAFWANTHDRNVVEAEQAKDMVITALRGPTREQVEKMRGEWIIEDAGDGDRRKKCSLCNQPISGWWGRDRFCANCGSPMTDEAVEMVMEKLEALYENIHND